jgi:DNA-binding response OmpR family regulator
MRRLTLLYLTLGCQGNGVDLARRIHDNFGRIPVVLMTGDPTARTNESVHEAGVSCLLIKPFVPRELVTPSIERSPNAAFSSSAS